MTVDLTGRELAQLHQALLAAFPDRAALARLTLFELDQNLNAISTATNMSDTVFDVLQWARAQGRMKDLIEGAHQTVPGNPQLKAFYEATTGGAAGSSGGDTETVGVSDRRLRRVIDQRFSLGEIRTLCFDLGIPYDDLAGQTKNNKITSLVEYARHDGRLQELIDLMIEERAVVRDDLYGA